MSLNGLDGVAVAEAHQAALAEAGGWYVARGDRCWRIGVNAVAQVPAEIHQS